MRLTTDQVVTIRRAAAEAFGADACVWLFGSRVDDSKRGGDIDLLVQTSQSEPDALAGAGVRMLARLYRTLRERKIDLIIDSPGLDRTREIVTTARRSGCAHRSYSAFTWHDHCHA